MIVVGHRGWLQKYPENTLAGFAAALELGVDALELDVHVTKDNRIAVIHDDEVDRTTDGKGAVRAMTLAELKSLDAGRWFDERFAGERIPTLDEVMELVRGKVPLAIEVKSPGETVDRLNRELVPLIRRYPGKVVVHSFDAGYLRVFRTLCPEVDAGFLCAASRKNLALAVEMGCTAIHPAWQTVTSGLNRSIRRAGLRIMVWIARSESDCRRILTTLDVDAIGADCPDVLIRILREQAQR
jgi:glycerophosphoryl diester phosphodiesterase